MSNLQFDLDFEPQMHRTAMSGRQKNLEKMSSPSIHEEILSDIVEGAKVRRHSFVDIPVLEKREEKSAVYHQ
jgi:hypothetical protein